MTATCARSRTAPRTRRPFDLGLHSPVEAVFVAAEIQSELNRVEQLLRWSEAKAASVPSWEGYTRLGVAPTTSRLLIVRETRASRATARDFRRLLSVAYPANPFVALDALVGTEAWPGAAILWAHRHGGVAGRYRIVARP